MELNLADRVMNKSQESQSDFGEAQALSLESEFEASPQNGEQPDEEQIINPFWEKIENEKQVGRLRTQSKIAIDQAELFLLELGEKY